MPKYVLNGNIPAGISLRPESMASPKGLAVRIAKTNCALFVSFIRNMTIPFRNCPISLMTADERVVMIATHWERDWIGVRMVLFSPEPQEIDALPYRWAVQVSWFTKGNRWVIQNLSPSSSFNTVLAMANPLLMDPWELQLVDDITELTIGKR